MSQCTHLLHSPEAWANGAGLMAGVQSFELRDVKGPLSLSGEHMVWFDIMGHPVRLIGKSRDKATITIGCTGIETPHTIIRAFVSPMGTAGAIMTLNIESDFEIDTENLKKALMTGLFSCIDANTEGTFTHPALRKYRAQLDKGVDETQSYGIN